MPTNLKLLFFVCILSAACAPYEEASSLEPEQDVSLILENINPDLEVIGFKDMDLASCGPIEAPPGYVNADFDGDGSQDYAILAAVNPPMETTMFNGKELDLHEMWIILITRLSDDPYEVMVYEKLETFIPSGVGIRVASTGVVNIQHDSGEDIVLENPGILVYFCEKSSKVVFWNGSRFVETGITD